MDNYPFQSSAVPYHDYPVPFTYQQWHPTSTQPYPMTFMQAPNPNYQLAVNYRGQDYLQGLSTIRGPFAFQANDATVPFAFQANDATAPFAFPIRNQQPAYPITHSIPSPYDRWFMNCKTCPYNN